MVTFFGKMSVLDEPDSGWESGIGTNDMSSSDSGEERQESSACCYCQQTAPQFLVKCVELKCQRFFCNGCTTDEQNLGKQESHIMSHLRISQHQKIAVYHVPNHVTVGRVVIFEYDQKYYKFSCASRSADGENFQQDEDSLAVGTDGKSDCFCTLVPAKLKKWDSGTKLIPMVDRHHPSLKCFTWKLVPVCCEDDQRDCKKMTKQEILDIERRQFLKTSFLLDMLNKPTLLDTAKNSFQSVAEYHEHFTGLIHLEEKLEQSVTIIAQGINENAVQWIEFETTSEAHKNDLKNEDQSVLFNAGSDGLFAAKMVARHDRKNTAIVRIKFEDPSVSLEDLEGPFGLGTVYENVRRARQSRALKYFAGNNHFHVKQEKIFSHILGTRNGQLLPQYDEQQSYDYVQLIKVKGWQLNDYQAKAVRMALASPLSLIQGPPGTGKTHTLKAIVWNVFDSYTGPAHYYPKVLCCAPSNVPTDIIAVFLSHNDRNLKVLRINSKKDQTRDVPDETKKLSLHYKLKQLLKEKYKEDNPEDENMIRGTEALIQEYHIICTTCNTSGNRALASVAFSDVIIDEATQASEADSLIPIMKARKRVVLIGDEHQLTVPKNIRFPELNHSNAVVSLFERMIINNQVPRVMLQTQYRMHPSICNPVSKVIYGGRLKAHEHVLGTQYCKKLSFIHPTSELRTQAYWIDTAQHHQKVVNGVSYINRQEADVVKKVVRNLEQLRVSSKDIGVITFYSAQKELLTEALSSSVSQGLIVDTVDHFQGGEKDYILLSCVRSGPPSYGSIGFLDEIRRMTVALSRARKGLVIVGNRELLESAEKTHWKNVIGYYPVIVEMGLLAINSLSPEQAYVRITGKEHDVNISGRSDRGPAFNGDSVLVEVYPREEWKIRSESIEEVQIALNIEELGDCVTREDIQFLIDNGHCPVRRLTEVREEEESFESQGRVWMDIVKKNIGLDNAPSEWLQRTGKVVSIVSKSGNRQFVGVSKQHRVHRFGHHVAADIAFVLEPTDGRMPRASIRATDIPEHVTERIGGSRLDEHLFHAEYINWDAQSHTHFAKITDVLQHKDDAICHEEVILIENDARNVTFPTNKLTDLVEKAKKRLCLKEPEVTDFRGHCTYTIDPPSAEDLDDAVSCHTFENGNLQVGVHIADVTAFIDAGSELDLHSRDRGTSLYMVRKKVHMLPKLIVDECSLLPGVDRRTVSVVFEFTPDGQYTSYHITRGIIHSRAKLSYRNAQDMIDQPNVKPDCLASINDDLALKICRSVTTLNGITQCLRRERFKKGAVSDQRSKQRYSADATGHYELVSEESLESMQLIEELAVLTNIVTAFEIQKAFPDLALLRRQPEPRDDLLRNVQKLCERQNIPLTATVAKDVQLIMKVVEETRPELLPGLQSMYLKRMRPAEYICTGMEKDTHHFSLDAPYYTHMTSPIRRYADICVHRLLLAAQAKQRDPNFVFSGMTPESVFEIANVSNARRTAAKNCETDSQSLYMGLHLRDSYDGVKRELGTVVAVYGASHALDILSPSLGITQRVFCRKLPGVTGVRHRVIDSRQSLELIWSNGHVESLAVWDQIDVTVSLENKNIRKIQIALTAPHAR